MSTAGGIVRSTVSDFTWKPNRADPQDSRLWAALLDARRRLTALMDARGPDDRIVNACADCLQRADAEAASSRYVAWDCLHQFDAETFSAMSDQQLQARWCTLRAEAEDKLKGGWRSQAAGSLVKLVKPSPESTPSLDILREVHAHLVTVAQNQQHKLDLFQSQSLPSVRRLLAAAVTVALAFSLAIFIAPGLVALRPWAEALVLGIPAGALGGILSTAFSIGRADLKAKIPDMRFSRLATLTRPLLGATVAIPILVFLQAEYVKVAGFNGPLAIAAFCFLGGFSERWFLGVMERFEAGKK